MVRAADLEPETLIKAIKAGDFYASSGVTLRDVRYDANKKLLQVDIEPEERRRRTQPNSSAPKSATTRNQNRASTKRASPSAPRASTRTTSARFSPPSKARRPPINSPARNSTSARSSPRPNHRMTPRSKTSTSKRGRSRSAGKEKFEPRVKRQRKVLAASSVLRVLATREASDVPVLDELFHR